MMLVKVPLVMVLVVGEPVFGLTAPPTKLKVPEKTPLAVLTSVMTRLPSALLPVLER